MRNEDSVRDVDVNIEDDENDDDMTGSPRRGVAPPWIDIDVLQNIF